MLHEGRMPLNDAENAAIDKLVEKHGGEAVQSFTRIEPGETGALHVTVAGDVYEVADDGKTRKLRG